MRSIRSVVPIVLAVLVVGACGGDKSAPAPERQAVPSGLTTLASSPCDVGASSVLADSAVAHSLSGSSRMDEEVGDCQRLVLGSGPSGEFGPLVALYPVSSTLKRPRSDFAAPHPAVAIYSWGSLDSVYADAYPTFAEGKGAACLWLRNDDGSAAGWKAGIRRGGACGPAAPTPSDSAFTLPVFEHVYPGTSAADYPATARWEWDQDARKQIVGVKCGDAWCEIAAPGSAAPKTQTLEGGNDVPRERVPGWSDAQFLAVYDSAASRARPGPWGSIVAYPGIAAASPPWTEGLLSGHIVVYGAAGKFADRYYLEPGAASGHDELILRFPGMEDEAWLQQGPMRRRKAKRIQFMLSTQHDQVGTIRWRWNDQGERIWSYCANGTCAVEP